MIRFSRDELPVKVAFEVDNDINMEDIVSAFREFCLALGYHPDTVNEALGEGP